MKRAVILDTITYLFIFLFVYAGVFKLFEIPQFKDQLLASTYFNSIAGFGALGLPVGELLLAFGLFVPRFRLKAFYATLGVMMVFMLYMVALFSKVTDQYRNYVPIIEELAPKQQVLFVGACILLSAIAIRMIGLGVSIVHVRWLPGTLIAGLFLFIGWILFTAFTASATAKSDMEGKLLPSFDLLLPDSVSHLNTGDIPRGRPFIVIGFDPFCTHCRGETRDIIKNIDRLRDTRIYYVTTAPFWEMRAFYIYFKLSRYPNIIVGVDSENSFFSHYKSSFVPYTAIFDSEKRLSKAFIAQMDARSLIKAAK